MRSSQETKIYVIDLFGAAAPLSHSHIHRLGIGYHWPTHAFAIFFIWNQYHLLLLSKNGTTLSLSFVFTVLHEDKNRNADFYDYPFLPVDDQWQKDTAERLGRHPVPVGNPYSSSEFREKLPNREPVTELQKATETACRGRCRLSCMELRIAIKF